MPDAWMLRLHRRVRASPLLYRLMVGTCVLLACGFVPTGLVKLLGRPFAPGNESTIGLFFDTLYRTGGWWQMIGAAQVLAGVLVLVPRLRTVGAVLFLAILVNIVAITVSLDFGTTELLAAQMLLAAFFLLVWDYDRLRPILGLAYVAVEHPVHRLSGPLERGVYAAGFAGGMVFFLATRGLGVRWPGVAEAAFVVAALAAFAAPVVGLWRTPRPWFRLPPTAAAGPRP